MTYRPSEKASVENPVVKYAQGLGIPVLKVNPLWAAGWPDRVFFVPGGRPLIIEFKRADDGKLRKKQKEIIGKLEKLDYEVYTVDTVEEGKALVRARLETHRLHEAGDEVGAGASKLRTVPRPRSAKD